VIATRYVSSPTEEPASLFFRYEFRHRDKVDCSSGTSFHQYAPGHFRMERRDKGQDIVLVASEPLTFERADWVTVPSNCIIPHLILVSYCSYFDDKWTDSVVTSDYWFVRRGNCVDGR
jgi:glutamine amidotransferase